MRSPRSGADQRYSERGVRSDFRGEGAMAGALGVFLGGPRPFGNETIAGAWVGDGRARNGFRHSAGDIF